ncbi:MAG: hypothetical protein SFU21_12260 [Flavihumibacter sp.]|nr:hypothetical protein [Flavihumibacter sp.]
MERVKLSICPVQSLPLLKLFINMLLLKGATFCQAQSKQSRSVEKSYSDEPSVATVAAHSTAAGKKNIVFANLPLINLRKCCC